MIGVDKELKSLQVRQGDDEVECLTVVVAVSGGDMRAVCGYGPQRRDTAKRKKLFWEYRAARGPHHTRTRTHIHTHTLLTFSGKGPYVFG